MFHGYSPIQKQLRINAPKRVAEPSATLTRRDSKRPAQDLFLSEDAISASKILGRMMDATPHAPHQHLGEPPSTTASFCSEAASSSSGVAAAPVRQVEVTDVLGEGGQCIVKKGRILETFDGVNSRIANGIHIVVDMPVAVKHLKPESDDGGMAATRLRWESQILRKIFEEQPKTPYVVLMLGYSDELHELYLEQMCGSVSSFWSWASEGAANKRLPPPPSMLWTSRSVSFGQLPRRSWRV
jgi:hypothetical protein